MLNVPFWEEFKSLGEISLCFLFYVIPIPWIGNEERSPLCRFMQPYNPDSTLNLPYFTRKRVCLAACVLPMRFSPHFLFWHIFNRKPRKWWKISPFMVWYPSKKYPANTYRCSNSPLPPPHSIQTTFWMEF